jgi:pyruvate ferredoxin oxidoreductase gamma subunit
MLKLRIHGRGGQGVISASQMISVAAFHQGLHAQAIPSFGSERSGAPVQAFVRIDNSAIELREPVLQPDILIIQDATLFHAIDVFSGLQPDGYVLINSRHDVEQLGVTDAVQNLPAHHVVTVPATDLALKHLRRPTPNTVLLGALAALHEFLDIDAVERAIAEKWPGKVGEINIKAARAAYVTAINARQESAHA